MMTSTLNSPPWDIITHWSLPYDDYLELLQNTTDELLLKKEKRFLIICSHPHCFTNGRGLRTTKDGPSLVHLTSDEEQHLPFPLYPINRGGGLTFHYPGQIIIYPIVNLNVFPRALMTLMHTLLITAGETLSQLHLIANFQIPKEVYGLWTKNFKVGSIGMGLHRYITQHGLALNFFHDLEMFGTLTSLFPCGISAQTYSTIESICQKTLSEQDRDAFVSLFIHNFLQKMKS